MSDLFLKQKDAEKLGLPFGDSNATKVLKCAREHGFLGRMTQDERSRYCNALLVINEISQKYRELWWAEYQASQAEWRANR
jgi:hypothetical protein